MYVILFFMTIRMPSFGIVVKSTQMDIPKAKGHSNGNLDPALSKAETILDGWDGISLEYAVDWPLQLFFTQEVLSK